MMESVRAIYEDGRVIFPEGQTPPGRMDVIVTFLDENASKTGAASTDGSGSKTSGPGHAGRRFVDKWKGILQGCDIEDWKDQKASDIAEKHQ